VKRSTGLALLGILLLAIVLRLLPLLRQAYWGSDFGEYYRLTRDLVEGGVVPTPYGGWGITYPYFPGFFVFNGAFVLAGVPVDAALVVLGPLAGALAVLPLFLVATRTTGDDLAGLAASAFLAVVMLHVYATSHPLPATLGDLLLLGAFLMYLGIRRSPKVLVLLIPTALAIIMTHHLATYALILAAVGSLLLRAILDSKIALRHVRFELAFLVVLVAMTIAYWLTYANLLWQLIVLNSPLSTGLLVAGAALGIAIIPAVILARRRVSWRFRPRTRSVRAATVGVGIAILAGFAIMIVSILASVPGTSIRLTPLHLVVFAPTVAFLCFGGAGRRSMDFSREGADVTGWFVALVLSVFAGGAIAATVLIPYRHLEYVVMPLAVMVGAGVRWLCLRADSAARRLAAVGIVGILVASSATVSVPPPAVMAGFDEGTDAGSATAVLWVRDNARGLVGGDHRLSSVLFGFARVDATSDRETRFWHEENQTAAVDFMRLVVVGDRTLRVDWIVIDRNSRAGLQTSPFEPPLPLLPAEEAKFFTAPFHKVYDSGFAQVYFVNWGLV